MKIKKILIINQREIFQHFEHSFGMCAFLKETQAKTRIMLPSNLKSNQATITCVGCLKNVRNVVQFNIFDMSSVIPFFCHKLRHFSSLEWEITLQTRLLLRLAMISWTLWKLEVVALQCNVARDHISCVCLMVFCSVLSLRRIEPHFSDLKGFILNNLNTCRTRQCVFYHLS